MGIASIEAQETTASSFLLYNYAPPVINILHVHASYITSFDGCEKMSQYLQMVIAHKVELTFGFLYSVIKQLTPKFRCTLCTCIPLPSHSKSPGYVFT